MKTAADVKNEVDTARDIDGNAICYSAAVNLMDDDIREHLHATIAPCDNQTFIEAYAAAHAEKFGGDKFAPYYGLAW